MLSIFSRDQPETVRTPAPSPWRAIRYAVLGLPFVGIGLFGLFIESSVFMAVFVGAGGWMWWRAYRVFRPQYTYGVSHLHLETAPVPLGESLRARIRVPIAADEQPPSGFQVHVAATDRRKETHETWWEDWTSVRGQPRPDETEVPLSIDLPVRPHPGNPTWTSLEDLDWTMKVTASFDDKPDYEASFDLPVSVPDDLDEQTTDDPPTDGSVSSPESIEPEDEAAPTDASRKAAYWNADDDGKKTDLRRAASEDESVGDEESAFSEPVTSRIELEDGPDHRLSVFFSPASSWKTVLGLSIPTFLVPLVVGVTSLRVILTSPSPPPTLGLIFIAGFVVAGASSYWYWMRWLHTATVTVENGAVELTNTPFFTNGSTTTIPCEALDEVRVEKTYRAQKSRDPLGYSSPMYALSLVKPPSRYRSTGPRSDQREIWVAGGLTNKAEADWIADRILQSAEEQASTA